MPETLTRKLETFRVRGIVPMYDEEIFPLDSWEALLTGHGLTPESFEPLVEATSDADLMDTSSTCWVTFVSRSSR